MSIFFKCIGIMTFLLLISCHENQPTELSAREAIAKSIEYHDPNAAWDDLEWSIRIQEPRVGNPARYSIIHLNNRNGVFELTRNRDQYLSRHIIDQNGEAKVYLDDSEEIADSLLEKYRLDPARNAGYRNFYQMMYGLPMSLKGDAIKEIGKIEISDYNGQPCYKIPITLVKKLFSEHWIIYLSKTDFAFKGMEIIFPDDDTKGERLYFDGTISIGNIQIPRFRHWHELTDDAYAGSDIIIEEIND